MLRKFYPLSNKVQVDLVVGHDSFDYIVRSFALDLFNCLLKERAMICYGIESNSS